MNRQVKGAILLFILGVVMIGSLKYLLPILKERSQRSSSDSKDIKGTITCGYDNWIGYYPFCSKEMVRRIRAAGYNLKPVQDESDMAARLDKLKKGELDFAMATVDSNILNGAGIDFPGVIIAVIDTSNGDDKIVARDGIQSLDDLKKGNFKIAFTPKSPSEHLIKGAAVFFDIPELRNMRGNWKIETNGSSEALKKLLAGEVKVAALWEPDASRALMNPGVVKLIDTGDMRNYIVDVLLVNRSFATDHPDMVNMVLYNYFQTLKYYKDNQEVLKKEIMENSGLPEAQVETMLKGVNWINLSENTLDWLGAGPPGSRSVEGLIESIESTVKILLEVGDFTRNPLPNEDPYRLVNKSFIADLYAREFSGPAGKLTARAAAVGSLDKRFAPLDAAGWKTLKEVGTLKNLYVPFKFGDAALDNNAKEQVDNSVKNLEYFPNYRIVVEGHTGLFGDKDENLKLSQERADAVKRFLEVGYNIDANRIRAVGMGSSNPLPRETGESDKAYGYRLPRVEFHLVTEVY